MLVEPCCISSCHTSIIVEGERKMFLSLAVRTTPRLASFLQRHKEFIGQFRISRKSSGFFKSRLYWRSEYIKTRYTFCQSVFILSFWKMSQQKEMFLYIMSFSDSFGHTINLSSFIAPDMFYLQLWLSSHLDKVFCKYFLFKLLCSLRVKHTTVYAFPRRSTRYCSNSSLVM